MTTLFQDVINAGLEYSNHESDLYLKDTPEARKLLEEHDKKGNRVYKVDGFNVQRFYHQETREPWLDVPFAYDPFWDKK